MGIDPLADTLRAAVETLESMGASNPMNNFIQFVLERRPVWQAQAAAAGFASQSAQAAPLWRWVRVVGPQWTEAVRGTSMVATVQGAAGLAVTMGIPLVVAVGSWVMLGAGYYQARKEIRQKGYMSGFSQGFTMGVLKWTWEQAVQGFAVKFVIRKNVWDSVMDREEALGYNEGLIKGWAAGSAVWETWYDKNQNKVVDKKKDYRIALRRLANIHADGEWSRNPDEARLQQRNYVIELAAAGMRHGLIVME